MTAPAPTPAEAAVIDRFGIFDEERVVEEVARVLFAATPDRHVWDNATNLGQHQRDEARRLARAAITAYRATDGDLRTRMADVADNLDYYAGKTTGGTAADGLEDAAGHIRDALR